MVSLWGTTGFCCFFIILLLVSIVFALAQLFLIFGGAMFQLLFIVYLNFYLIAIGLLIWFSFFFAFVSKTL